MDDASMDAELQAAGERWRSDNQVDVPTVDFEPVTPVRTSHHRRNRWLLVASAAVVVAAVAVGGTWLDSGGTHRGSNNSGDVPSSLTRVSWKIDSLTLPTGDSNSESPGDDANLHFSANGTFTGNDGVNSMSGSVQVDGTTMHFGRVAITAIGTTDKEIGAVAATIDSIVQGDATWVIQQPTDQEELLIGDARAQMTLIPIPPGGFPPPDLTRLTGIKWMIDSVLAGTPTAYAQDVPGSTGFLLINADGSFTGSDGCNAISGEATLAADTLTFGRLVTRTDKACTGLTAAVASIIDATLQGRVDWTVNPPTGHTDLALDKSGAGHLDYLSGTVPPPTVDPATVDPSKMPGTWYLAALVHGSGLAESSSSVANYGEILVIDSDGTFKVQHRCYANVGNVAIGAGTATWSNVHLAGAIPCPGTAPHGEQATDSTVDTVLSGATTWVSGTETLSITNGDDTLIYRSRPVDGSGPTS